MFKAISSGLLAAVTAFSLMVSNFQSLIPTYPVSIGYDYSRPIPASEQRGDAWFADSAFIGHSLIEGFEVCADIDANIHYFTDTGLSAARAVTYSQFSLPDGGTGTLEEGLRQKAFSKIYIMLGVNEISTTRERFKENMAALVETVRANQPGGIPIYILELTPTTQKKSDATAFNRANVQKLNEVLSELCEEEKCYLVDLSACFADGDGYLPAEVSRDGVHLKAPQYRVMADYLLTHTVEER